MLSHESRYFVVVGASAVAGAAVAWVPLTSAPLPFRENIELSHLGSSICHYGCGLPDRLVPW